MPKNLHVSKNDFRPDLDQPNNNSVNEFFYIKKIYIYGKRSLAYLKRAFSSVLIVTSDVSPSDTRSTSAEKAELLARILRAVRAP